MFLQTTIITNKLLVGFWQEGQKILMVSYASSVQINQFYRKKRKNIDYAILDVSLTFYTTFWVDKTLYSSVQQFLSLQKQPNGQKQAEISTKHQLSLLSQLIHHIHNRKPSHLTMAMGPHYYLLWGQVNTNKHLWREKTDVHHLIQGHHFILKNKELTGIQRTQHIMEKSITFINKEINT